MQRRNNRSRFVWSLDPIFGWMRLIGIELDCSIIRSKRESLALLSFSILLFVFSFVCNVWVLVHKLTHLINKDMMGRPISFVKSIVFSMNIINIVFLSVCSHFAFMIGVQRNWHQLFKTIQQMLYVSVMFDCLKENFQTILKAPNASQIEIWRRNHVLVCQLVDNINDCFGVVLLISVGCYFVSSISASYELYVLLQDLLIGRYSPKIGYLFHIISINIRDAIHFSLLVALPFRMKRKVSVFINQNTR